MKKIENNKYWDWCGKPKLSYIADEGVIRRNDFGKRLAVSEHMYTLLPNSSTPKYTSNRNAHDISPKNILKLFLVVVFIIVKNLETPGNKHPSTVGWINRSW
jgi:hypothetical protein